MPELDLDDALKRYHFALAPEDYERLPFYSALIAQFEGDPLALELLDDATRVFAEALGLVVRARSLAGANYNFVIHADSSAGSTTRANRLPEISRSGL